MILDQTFFKKKLTVQNTMVNIQILDLKHKSFTTNKLC